MIRLRIISRSRGTCCYLHLPTVSGPSPDHPFAHKVGAHCSATISPLAHPIHREPPHRCSRRRSSIRSRGRLSPHDWIAHALWSRPGLNGDGRTSPIRIGTGGTLHVPYYVSSRRLNCLGIVEAEQLGASRRRDHRYGRRPPARSQSIRRCHNNSVWQSRNWWSANHRPCDDRLVPVPASDH
jgi:hypothetical protein